VAHTVVVTTDTIFVKQTFRNHAVRIILDRATLLKSD